MTLIDRLKQTLGSDAAGENAFRYHCRECDSEFELTEPSRSNVECPNCGATGTRSITKF